MYNRRSYSVHSCLCDKVTTIFSEEDLQYTEQFRIAEVPSGAKSPCQMNIDLGIATFDPSMYKANRQVQKH